MSVTDPKLSSLDQLLSLMNNGDFLGEVLAAQKELIANLQDHRTAYMKKAKGSLTLKIDMTLDEQGTLELVGEVKNKTPDAPKAKGVAWTTQEGGITPTNPRQMRMELRTVSEEPEIRTTS